MLTKLYVSAQVALPDWARGRGLAVFLTFIFGATTVGSAVWGKVSAMEGLPIAYFAAAAGVVSGDSADLGLEASDRRRDRFVPRDRTGAPPPYRGMSRTTGARSW